MLSCPKPLCCGWGNRAEENARAEPLAGNYCPGRGSNAIKQFGKCRQIYTDFLI